MKVRVFTSAEVRKDRLAVAEFVAGHIRNTMLGLWLVWFLWTTFGEPATLRGPWLVIVAVFVFLVVIRAPTLPVNRIREGNAQDASTESSGSTSGNSGASLN